ncbi:hypothetical protein [Rheinheimera maricola]|uniref:hypothetical protein n=1 Tax=Rheinheimera maricola TaxID=2793282 RepID=UPI0019650A7C|nr:hypothetical protein [Rheinheimera maricola]
MLQTANPNSPVHSFIFGRKLLDYDRVAAMNFEERMASYEAQLNLILQKDPNTKSCFIVPGTINFGEPGSQAEAQAQCTNSVRFEIQKGIYTLDGAPFYSYTLPNE